MGGIIFNFRVCKHVSLDALRALAALLPSYSYGEKGLEASRQAMHVLPCIRAAFMRQGCISVRVCQAFVYFDFFAKLYSMMHQASVSGWVKKKQKDFDSTHVLNRYY